MAKDKELRSYQKRYVGKTPTSVDPTTAAPTVDSSMPTEMPTGRTFGTSKKIRDGDPEPDANDPAPIGVPMDLGKVSPYDRGLVNRVTEPYGGVIDDNTTTGEKMGGFWGGALDLADDFFPDDLGGLIAGDSEQWVRVPYLTDAYKHTLGGGLAFSMEKAGAGLNALTWTADQVNAGLAWGMTALPGGPRTMDLELEPNNWGGLNTVGEGAEISAGQAAMAVYGSLFRAIGTSNLGEVYKKTGGRFSEFIPESQSDGNFDDAREQFIEEYAFFASEDFDLYDEEDRKKAFEDQNLGKYLSGVQDASVAVVGDPLFFLSKPFKVLAFGGRIGNKPVGGYLNQNLETKVAKNNFIEDMEKGLDLHFTEGNNSTASFREIAEFVDASPRDLSRAKKGNILIKYTDNPGAMKSIKQALSEDRDEALAEMVSVVKILLQDETGLLTLQGGNNPRLLDVVARELNDGVSYFQATRPIDDFGVKLGNDLIADARSILDDMYPVETRPQSPFIPKPPAPKPLVGGATLRSGGTKSDTAAKLKVNARQGFAESDARPTRRQKRIDPEAARLREATVETYESEGFIWNIVKATAASRPIALVRWGNKGLPTGIIHLKGGDGVNSDLEFANWLRETELTPAQQSEFLAKWADSSMSPAAKRNILIEAEKATITAIGKRLGKDYKETMEIYESYNGARWKALSDQLDPEQGGKGFSVAEDNETLIKAADMYSVLDEQFPMLDVREFRNVVSNIGDMGTIIGVAKNTGAKAADILNNGWKVSVLLRFGYTARNLTEGALRSVATMGFMATNPEFLSRIPASVTYQAYKAYYGRNARAQASAVQNAMKQNAEALDALKMFGEEDKLSDIARLEEALLEEQARLARLIEADDAATNLLQSASGNDQIFNSLVNDAKEAGIKLDDPRGGSTIASEIYEFRSTKLLESNPSLKTRNAKGKVLVDLSDNATYKAYMKMFYPSVKDDTVITLYRGVKQGEDVFKTTGGAANASGFAPGFGSYWTTNPIVANGFGANTKVVSIDVRFGDIKNFEMNTSGKPRNTRLGPDHGLDAAEEAIVLDYSKLPDEIKNSVKEVDFKTPEGSTTVYDALDKLNASLKKSSSDPSNLPVMEPAIALKPANGPIEIGPTKSEIRLKELEERIVSLETDRSFLIAQNRKDLNKTGRKTPGYNKTLKSIEDKLKTAKAGKKKLTSYGEDGRSVIVREQMAARAKIAKQRAREYKAEKKLVEGYNKDARKVYEKNIEDIKTEIINRNKGIDEAVVGVDEAQMQLDDAKSLFDDSLPELENLKATRALLAKKLFDEAEMLKKILAQIEGKGDWKYFGRQKIGTGGNVVGRDENGNDIVWDAAFDGSDGQMARILSSADSTYQEVFKTGFLSKMNRDRKLGEYDVMDPYKIGDGPESSKKWNQYWNNYLDRINRRYKQDKIVSRWLTYGDDERDMVAKATDWVMGSSQQNYRSNFGLNDASGKADPAKVRAHIDMMYKNYSKELPIGSGLRETLNSSPKGVTKEQLLSSLGDSELPVIPVLREGKEHTGLLKHATRDDAGKIRPFASTGGAVGSVVSGLMKVLGSIPETKLLRHPYYAAVYRKEQLRMANMAKADGKSIGDARIRDRINSTAHRYALQQTRKTLYTIERQTSGSQALRFFFPFFPAWSNTLRTWSGIAYQNPAIVAYANAMWNIPNSLGWVVDGDGNKVEFSNMFSSDEDTFIIQPESLLKATLALRKIPVAGYLASKTPVLNTMIPVMDEDGNAIPVATRQSGLNVVFTGGIMDPGVGPLTPIATGLILRGKPELTEVLRKSMGDDMFRRIVANGDPNTPIKDIVLPTFIKRAYAKMFAGENENTAFLRLQNTMTQDAIITAAAVGKVLTQEDFEKVIRNADALWNWTIDQSLTAFTASTSYRSPYTVERKIWRDLLDNTSLVYSKKIDKFMNKMGELHPDQDPMTYFGLTGSTSESAFKVNSNQQSYDRLTKNPKIVEGIADDLGKEFVGQFTGIGDQSEPFSYSVYGELQNHSIGNDLVKEKMTAEELFKKDQISKGWQEFFLAIDSFDDQAKSVGLESYKDLGDDVIDAVEDYKQSLGEKYPAYGNVIRIDYDISTTSKRLEVARITVESASVKDRRKIPTIGVLEEYLQGRDVIISLLDDVDGLDMQVTKKAELKKEIRKQGYLFAGTLRNKDIGFSEYYDRYFSNDTF